MLVIHRTYTGVPLYVTTGSGTGATATIVITAQGIEIPSIKHQCGLSYVIGDVLGLTTSTMVMILSTTTV